MDMSWKGAGKFTVYIRVLDCVDCFMDDLADGSLGGFRAMINSIQLY